MAGNQRDLTTSFKALQQTQPALVRDASLIGGGHFGLVADHHDGTVSKFMFRQNHPDGHEGISRVFENEIIALKVLHDVSLNGVEIPRLTEPPRELDDENFFATYRMSAVAGTPAKWNFDTQYDGGLTEEQQQHFRDAGTLLARFHAVAGNFLDENSGLRKRGWSEIIERLPQLDEETNKSLEAANHYLQANRRETVVHGDFHGGNIMIDENMKPVSLFDFGETAISGNPMTDFMNVPSAALPHFVKGYEEESGLRVDQTMITLANISGNLIYLSYWWDDPEKRAGGLDTLHKNLEAVQSVTGIAPPRMR